MYTISEENYLKTIFKITEKDNKVASTNAIAAIKKTSPASVIDMIKKLSEKGLVNYEKYKGVSLSVSGMAYATKLIRKHRLWEVFLVKKLNFSWDEIHEIAEELEHINSAELIDRLDNYLGNPKFDPHGDPIPNAQGRFTVRNQITLNQLNENETGILIGVKDQDSSFLKYLNELQIKIGSQFKLIQRIAFDDSCKVLSDDGQTHIFSQKITKSLFVKREK